MSFGPHLASQKPATVPGGNKFQAFLSRDSWQGGFSQNTHGFSMTVFIEWEIQKEIPT